MTTVQSPALETNRGGKSADSRGAPVVLSAFRTFPEVFFQALTIRLLETKLLKSFLAGKVNGTVHT